MPCDMTREVQRKLNFTANVFGSLKWNREGLSNKPAP